MKKKKKYFAFKNHGAITRAAKRVEKFYEIMRIAVAITMITHGNNVRHVQWTFNKPSWFETFREFSSIRSSSSSSSSSSASAPRSAQPPERINRGGDVEGLRNYTDCRSIPRASNEFFTIPVVSDAPELSLYTARPCPIGSSAPSIQRTDPSIYEVVISSAFFSYPSI